MPWTRLVAAGELVPGAVRDVTAAGRDLVVWRTSGGACVVMDARCPHQWSHLGAEGVVDGDELVCAAHFWRFDAQGRGSKVNVNGRRDPKADIAVFPCRVTDGALEADVPGAEGSHP